MLGRNPVAIATALSVAIKAILLAVIAFGFQITADQLAAVMFAVDAVLGLTLVLVVQPQVVTIEKANSQIALGIQSPKSTTVDQVIAKEEANSK